MDLAAIESIARAASAADGAEPLDEGAWRRLRHHADELDVVVDGGLLHLVVAPEARRQGVGRGLADRVLAGSDQSWQAWSHGDHPGAAALARELGFERSRALWVMRRSLAGFESDPVTAEGFELRSFRP